MAASIALDAPRTQTAIRWLLTGYAFLMGFVFVEPAPAEWLLVLALPLCVVLFWEEKGWLSIAGLLFFLPRLLTVVLVMRRGDPVAWRFLLIDAYLFVLFCAFFLAFRRHHRQTELFHSLMLGWIAAALVNIAAGGLAFALGRELLFGSVRMMRIGIRLEGFFKDPNVFGSFLIPVLAYSLARFLDAGTRLRSALYCVLFVVLGLGLVMTFSRGSWLGAAVAVGLSLLYYLVRANKRARRRALWLLLAGGLVLGLVLLLDPAMPGSTRSVRQYFFDRLGLEAYDSKRFSAWAAALDLAKDRPLAGLGPGQFEKHYTMSVHNSYLRFFAELGLLGILSHLAMLWLFVRRAGLGVRAYLRTRPVAPAIAFLGMLASALFIDAFHWRHFIVFAAIVMAWTAAVKAERQM